VKAPRLVLALLASGACGLPEPVPYVRVLAVTPADEVVPPEGAVVAVIFSGPVAAAGVVDGGRVLLVPASAVRAALGAAESEDGAAALPEAIPAAVALEAGGTRAVLRPAGPLRARTAHVLVISSRLVDADGRPVLDADGRRRPTVAEFSTGASAGPPPRPVLTEARVDAETPEAGGEWVEVANLGDGPLDLTGHRLWKRSASGATASCPIEAPGPVPPGEAAVIAGGALDGREALPPGAVLARCGASAVVGGLANDHPPELRLLDPAGAVLTTLGAGGAPVCAVVVRLDLDGPDAPSNLACGEGTPGSW
jgi:hypothetical protein